jgi:Polyketide cyclase / dehydrase and lipid transport
MAAFNFFPKFIVLAYRNRKNRPPMINGAPAVDVSALIEEAFLPVENSLDEIENQLRSARSSLREAKYQAITAMEAIEVAAMAQAEGAVQAVIAAEEAAGRKVLEDIYVAAHREAVAEGNQHGDESELVDNSQTTTISEARQLYVYDDVDYSTSEMAAPFLGEDQCLVLGEPVARVEKAPENSRRIFAGIDIPHSVDDVWGLLTDYPNLQSVVPNLVLNEVLEEYNTDDASSAAVSVGTDSARPEEVQCQGLANQMKGAKLRQIGGAKVAGIRFSARTTLEVREWPNGLPDFAHFNDEYWEGKSRKERIIKYSQTPLTRYKFPRPFALSKLPTRDISMQSIERDDGEFRMYQGVWRMQPLPGCAPPGKNAMRLTYAVEVSPRAYLPVQLVEGRIVSDLCNNLVAIRDYLAAKSEPEVERLSQATSTR